MAVPSQPTAPVNLPTPGAVASRNRRRPASIVLGVLLIVTSALATGYAFNAVSSTQAVVGLTRDVAAGEVIAREALSVVHLGAGAGLATVPADRLDEVVGQRATRDLAAGTTLTPSSVSEALLPSSGRALVGVVATPGRAPASGLVIGARVILVELPDKDTTPSPATLSTTEGTVIAVEPAADGNGTRVDVDVAAQDAQQVQRLAAGERIALVIVSKER